MFVFSFSFWSFAISRIFWYARYFSFSLPDVDDGNRQSKLSKFHRILHCTQSEVNSFEAFSPKHRTISFVCWKRFAVFEFLSMLPRPFSFTAIDILKLECAVLPSGISAAAMPDDATAIVTSSFPLTFERIKLTRNIFPVPPGASMKINTEIFPSKLSQTKPYTSFFAHYSIEAASLLQIFAVLLCCTATRAITSNWQYH